MLEVLSDPGGFFEEKIKEEIDLKPPYAVIGTVTLLTLINAFILMRELMGNLVSDVPTIVQLIVITLGLMVTMASGMIVWLMISGLFYVFSWLLAGQGKFTRVLEFVAYGFLPFIFSSAISMVLMISMCSFSDFAMNDPQAIEKAMLKSPYMIVSNAISIIIAIWSANIWVFAMVHSRSLSIKNAMITVGIPIGLYLIYMLYTLYQAIGQP
jgi:hypothetical protein